MRKPTPPRRLLLPVLIALAFSGPVLAMPSGATFVSGSGSLSGNTLTVNGVNGRGNALVTYSGGFDIGKAETFNIKDSTGSGALKNIVNYHGGPNPAQLSGGIYADNTLRVLVVSPTGVNIDSTATIRAASFAAFAGSAAAQPDGQIVVTGNGAPINFQPGAALITGSNGFAIGAGKDVTFQVPTYIQGTLPWVDGATQLRVDNALQLDGELATLVGNIRSGTYDMAGGNLVLTGTGTSGSASVVNANSVTLQQLQLGQGTAAEGAVYEYDADGNLTLTQPGASGTVSGFALTVGSAAAPVKAVSIQDVRVLGTSRLDAYADQITTNGINKLVGQLTAKSATLSGVLDGFRQTDVAGQTVVAGGGYATINVTEALNLSALTVKSDHVLDVRLNNTTPMTISGARLAIEDAFVFVRTLGSNVTLSGWTLTGAPTTAENGNNQLNVTSAKGTVDATGRGIGANGWLDLTIDNMVSDNVYLRVDNGTLTDRGLRDVTVSNSTINQGNNSWSGLHIEPARSVSLISSRIDAPLGALEDNRTLITTRGYLGVPGTVTLTDSTVRGANVIIGGGYGQLQNSGLSDVTALNPDYVPGSEPNGSDWYNSGSYWDQLLGHASSYQLTYDPVTGRVDAARNTGVVTLSGSTVEGLSTAKIAAKTSVSVDSGSRVEALNVGTKGMTLIAGDTITYGAGAQALASYSNLVKGAVTGTVSANPVQQKSDGSATAQAYIAAPTVSHSGLIRAGGDPIEGAAAPHTCEINPASCYTAPSTNPSVSPVSPVTDITGNVITAPSAPGSGSSVDAGEFEAPTPIVIGRPGGAPAAPVITNTNGQIVNVILAPGGWIPTDGSYFTSAPTPGSVVTVGGNNWLVGNDLSLQPIVGGNYDFGAGAPALTWNGNSWVGAPVAGSTITSGGVNWQYDGSSWIAVLTPGQTLAQDGNQYSWDGSNWIWAPSIGSTATGGNGIGYTWDGGSWVATPIAGQTVTSGGITYSYSGSAWAPAAGSTTTADGKSYSWDGSSWNWLPGVGSTVTQNGTQYTYDGSSWIPQIVVGQTSQYGGHSYSWDGSSWIWTPQIGEQISQNGSQYTYNGSAWIPATGTQTTINGDAYRWDGSAWAWLPAVGSSVSDAAGNSWAYDGSAWVPAPGVTGTHLGVSYTWDGSAWLPAVGSTVTTGESDYTWDGSSWAWSPVIGSIALAPDSDIRYVWTGSTWLPQLRAGDAVTSGGSSYTWAGDAWQPVTGTRTTQAGRTYEWDGSAWTWLPRPGDTLTGTIPYVYDGSSWIAKPLPGTTIGTTAGGSWTWTDGRWRPADGTTTVANGTDYVWDRGGWQPVNPVLPGVVIDPPIAPDDCVSQECVIPAPGAELDAATVARLRGLATPLPIGAEGTGGVGNWRVYLGAEKIAR